MGPTRENRAAGPAHVRRSKVVATKETPGSRLGSPAVLALQRAAGNQAVCALLAGAAPLQRQPSGPAAKIPLDRGDVERGFFSRTKTVTYGVRAAGPAKPEGLWFDHLFETRAQADAYAKSLAAQGETAIRDVGALPRAWPAKTPGGLPVTGNAVVNVYVLEVPAGTPTISGVVRSQPESAATPGLPKSYPGGGPQVVVAAGTNAKVVGVFRVQGAHYSAQSPTAADPRTATRRAGACYRGPLGGSSPNGAREGNPTPDRNGLRLRRHSYYPRKQCRARPSQSSRRAAQGSRRACAGLLRPGKTRRRTGVRVQRELSRWGEMDGIRTIRRPR